VSYCWGPTLSVLLWRLLALYRRDGAALVVDMLSISASIEYQPLTLSWLVFGLVRVSRFPHLSTFVSRLRLLSGCLRSVSS